MLAPHQGRDDYRGVEDPRITPLDGTFYMTYTAYGADSYFPMIARSQNLITWEDVGPLERAENKDHILFPEKIGGRYAILHRRSQNIWLGFSHDLRTWTDHSSSCPRARITTGIRSASAATACHQNRIRLAAFLSRLRPGLRLPYLRGPPGPGRPAQGDPPPAQLHIEPEETWEIKGDVGNVVFSCSNSLVGDEVWVYYAGADRLVGLATAPFADVLDYARHG